MSAPPFNTPNFFTEQRNTVFYHNIRIYIAGADVTPWLTSQVTINRADRDGIGSATFNLSNQLRALEITQDNVVGNIDGTVSIRTTQAPGSSNPPGFRLTDPYLPEGRYSELAKFTIFSNKNGGSNNLIHSVKTFGPISGSNTNPSQTTPLNAGSSGATILTGARNVENPGAAFTARYPFNVGSLVFHKYDPVRIFVQNPFSRGDQTSVTNSQLPGSSTSSASATSNTSQWTCEFAGYVDVKPFSQNYVSGESVVSISCQDIRVLMQQMRTQTNPAAAVGNENALVFTKGSRRVAATANAGFFNDLIAPFAAISHVLAGYTFLQSMNFLLFGIVSKQPTTTATSGQGAAAAAAPGNNSSVQGGQNPQLNTQAAASNLGAVGYLTLGGNTYYDPTNPDTAAALLEDWNNLVNFGSQKRYWTYAEMLYIGSQTYTGGEWAPENQEVFFLLPASGTPQSNLIGYNVDANITARIEWASRLELIQQICKGIDYQFYVSGMGDVIFEFPCYDFLPTNFNTGYNQLYSFGGHCISDSVNDEGGSPISGLVVTSRNLFDEISTNNPASGQTNVAGVATSQQLTRTIFSNVLASRIGVHIETHDVPGITDQNRLTVLGMIEFNKRLAEYNKFDMETSYRPYIGVNRPIYHMIRKRLGITKSVSYTWRIREDVSLHMDLSYTRQQEQDGKFRFITGGEAQPISYSKIYDSAYLSGGGVETSIGGPGTAPDDPAPNPGSEQGE